MGVEKREPSCSVGGPINSCGHNGKQYGFSTKKLKIELPFIPSILLLGIYPKKTKHFEKIYAPLFITVLFILVKIWKQPNFPLVKEWIDKMWYVYVYIYIYIHTYVIYIYMYIIYDGILNSHKRESLLFVTTWMELEGIMLSIMRQTGKDKSCIISFVYGI